MSISLCFSSGNNSCVSSSAIMAESAQESTSKATRNRLIIGTADSTGLLDIDKDEETHKPKKPSAKGHMSLVSSGTIPLMHASSKSKKCYTSSFNRKKQNQQHIIDSLKSWSLKITPSGLDKLDDELPKECSAPYIRNKPPGNQSTSQRKEYTQCGASVRNTMLNSEQVNRVPSTEVIKYSIKKKGLEAKGKNMILEQEKENHSLTKSDSKGKELSKQKASDIAKGSGETVEDGVYIHSSRLINTMTLGGIGSSTTTASFAHVSELPRNLVLASSIPDSSFSVRGNQLKHLQKSSSRSTTNISQAAVSSNAPHSPTSGVSEKLSGSKLANGSTNTSQTRSSVMSLMLQGAAKPKDSLRPEQCSSNSGVPSSVLKTSHSNHPHSRQHHASYVHQLGPQQPSQQAVIGQNQDAHLPSQQSNVSSHHHTFDFMRDFGLKMSIPVAGGGSNSTGDGTIYGSSQMNYNFTQQFQQHMLQHHHNNLPPHSHSLTPGQPAHQQQPQLQLHRIVPQPHHYHRSHNGYGGDELTQQCSSTGEAQAYCNYTLVNTGEVHNSMHASKNIDLSAYVYNQNGVLQPPNGQALHYQHPPPPQQQQQHNMQMQNYHQNNNYQYHNRNGNGGCDNQLNYVVQGGGRHVSAGQSREESGRAGGNGKKSWNVHGKGKGNSMQVIGGNKHVSKVQNGSYGYRKNYHHYHNHPIGGGHQYYDNIPIQQPQQQQHHYNHKQQHLHRNLVYVRGFDRGHGAATSHEYSNLNAHHEQEPKELGHASATNEQPRSLPLESEIPDTVPETSQNSTIESTTPEEDETAADDILIDTMKVAELNHDDEFESKKHHTIARLSSSSSVMSIPSTESSTQSLTSSQNHLLEGAHVNGHGYDSDSSHSSDYQDGTYQCSNYSQTNGDQVYRSSSSTSSGISSSATYPPSAESIPSMPSSLHASSTGLMGEFFIRSQSYHGSHQSLVAYGSGYSVGDGSPLAGSPSATPRPVSGTQSVPILGELFGKSNHSHPKLANSQSTNNFGSSSSLELALQTASASSSSSSSLSASSVPPNDFQSMQSGHPKLRSQSGRTSPNNGTVLLRANRTATVASSASLFTATKGQSCSVGAGRRNNQVSLSYGHRTSLPANFQYTPADRFILRANDVEMKTPPDSLTSGSCWDGLSQAIWEKFVTTQQSEEKYLQKMQLWRDLYISIKKEFPKYSLYLVGSTISGFGADNSDVDMCLVSRSGPLYYDPRLEALLNLSVVKEYFVNLPSTSYSEFSLIQAKVPILRFQDSKNGIEVDLNFNNCVGIRNTHLLYCYSQMDWRVRPLVLMVKLWAQHHNINDAKSMTISSYSLVLMVIHFLQCGTSPPVLPCLHAFYPEKFMKIIDIHNIEMIERIEPYQTDNKESLGELLLHFLDYYTKFDYEHHAISVRTSSVIPIEECRSARSYKNDPHHWKHLCIEEPFDLTNTARSVFDGDVFEQIKSTFATSWRMLKASKDLNDLFGEPLFTPVTSTLSITS